MFGFKYARSHLFRSVIVVFILCTAVTPVIAGGSSATDELDSVHPANEVDSDPLGFLQSAQWSASVLTFKWSGTVCWIQDDAGALRVELLVFNSPEFENWTANSDDTNLRSMLTQQGDGWSIILGPDNVGTINVWGQEWKKTPPALGNWVRLILDNSLGAGNLNFPLENSNVTSLFRTKLIRSAVVHRHRESSLVVEMPPLSLEGNSQQPSRTNAVSEFRKRQVYRGSGRGGNAEMVRLSWQTKECAWQTKKCAWQTKKCAWQTKKCAQQTVDASGKCFRLLVSSSRKPGELLLTKPVAQKTLYPRMETFLPLWPLGDLLEFTSSQ